MDLEQSLLHPSREQSRDIDDEESQTRTPADKCRWMRLFGVVVCGILLLLILATVGFLYETGAFSKVVRDVRIVNGSVVEPNTHVVFPLERRTTLDGRAGPQRIVGTMMKVRHIPELHASLRIFALAMYVHREQARRVLKQFKSRGCPPEHEQPEAFARFRDLVASGEISVTFEYHMVFSSPGQYMQNDWLAELVDEWEHRGLESSRIEKLKQCFETWWTQRGFRKGDIDIVEFHSTSKNTMAESNGRILEPACADEEFGRGFITQQFFEQGGSFLTNLFPTLWNTEYDDLYSV